MSDPSFTREEVFRLSEYEALYHVLTRLRAAGEEETLVFWRLHALYHRVTHADLDLVIRAWGEKRTPPPPPAPPGYM